MLEDPSGRSRVLVVVLELVFTVPGCPLNGDYLSHKNNALPPLQHAAFVCPLVATDRFDSHLKCSRYLRQEQTHGLTLRFLVSTP